MNGDPYTIQYGPWAPDLANVAVTFQSPYGATTVPCADVLNVYYSNGSYKSLPSFLAYGGFVISVDYQVIGAYTFTATSGAPIPIAGLANGSVYALSAASTGNVVSPAYPAIQCNLAQFNQELYSQIVPAQFALAGSGNLYKGISAAPLISGAPIGAVMGVIGQFLVVGDICGSLGASTAAAFTAAISGTTMTVSAVASGSLAVGNDVNGSGVTAGTKITALGTGAGGTGTYTVNNSLSISSEAMTSSGKTLIGVGNGSSTTFTGILNIVPAYPTSVSVTAGSIVGIDTGQPVAGIDQGQITGTGITGSVAYTTGNVTVTFTSAPSNGTLILADSGQAYRSRVQWPAIDDPTNWPIPLTDAAIAVQSSYEDLQNAYGRVMAVSGYPLYGVILQRNAISRFTYVGGEVVFQIATYAYNQGLVAKGAWVQVGQMTYFLSDAGFLSTDGANVYPIGTAPDNSAGIDNWFWANVNQSALSAISAGYDGQKRCVFFAIPTGSNTLPDTLLTYNILSGRWTRGTCSSSVIWTDTSGGIERLGIFNQSRIYGGLNGIPNAGYLESCDFVFTDGRYRYVNAVRPIINCSDIPTVTVGYRNTLEDAVLYSQAMAKDKFSGIAPFLVGGIYLRARLTSANGQSLHGATLFLKNGGEV